MKSILSIIAFVLLATVASAQDKYEFATATVAPSFSNGQLWNITFPQNERTAELDSIAYNMPAPALNKVKLKHLRAYSSKAAILQAMSDKGWEIVESIPNSIGFAYTFKRKKNL